jgi:hypothetical protein
MVTCHLSHDADVTGLGRPTDAMGRWEVTRGLRRRSRGPEEEQNIGKMTAGGRSCS